MELMEPMDGCICRALGSVNEASRYFCELRSLRSESQITKISQSRGTLWAEWINRILESRRTTLVPTEYKKYIYVWVRKAGR